MLFICDKLITLISLLESIMYQSITKILYGYNKEIFYLIQPTILERRCLIDTFSKSSIYTYNNTLSFKQCNIGGTQVYYGFKSTKNQNKYNKCFSGVTFQKALEKITIKELAQLANINKATFYTHYTDIYDLSEQVECEIISSILCDVNHPEYLIENPKEGVKVLGNAMIARQPILSVLYAGNRHSRLIDKLETMLKEMIYENFPQYKDNLRADIFLTILIQGTFHAYEEHKEEDPQEILEIISSINENLIHSI